MSNSGMEPQRAKSSMPGTKPVLVGDPASEMNASLTWSGGGVTISFPASEIYSDDTSQSWTWNTTTKSEGATTRSDSFATSNASGNTLTVVQNRPSGAVTFTATGIARNAASATLARQ